MDPVTTDQTLADGVEILPTRLNPTDATLWDIERNPNLRTTIVAVMMLDQPVEHQRLLDVLEGASRLIPRLRQRVVGLPGGIGTPYWDLVTDLDIRDHVSFVEVDGPVTEADVAAVAEPLASSPLDRSRPLWECTYIGGPSGRSALVLKVHHSLTDGVGGMGLLDVMLDRTRDAVPRDLDRLPLPRRGRRSSSLADDLEAATQKMVMLPFEMSSAAVTAAGRPLQAVSDAWGGARSAARLLAPSSSPRSTLFAGRSMHRHIGTSEIDLARVHDAAARHGCTINHAFFAGTVAGVAEYHRALGAPVDDLRVTMPVSIRRSDSDAAGNQWAPVRFVVPTDIDDPVESMLAMRRRVTSSRREPALGFSQSLAGLVQVLPSVMSSAVVGGMVRGVDMTLTNVPGLTEPHYLGGAEVVRIFAFAPTAGAALNVGLVSHLDTLCIGTLSDAAAVDDPDLLQELIAAGMEELVAAAETTEPRPDEPADEQESVGDSERAPAERLSALDTGFLRLESPETQMHIGGVFVIEGEPLRGADGRIRMHDARRHIEARLRQLPRFKRRLAEVPLGVGRPLWVDDEDFAITRHVRSATVPSPGTRQELLNLCAELYEEPIDRAHPLWELWIIDGLADGRVGIVEKVHHALIDGISGVELAAAIFDPVPDTEPDVPVRHAGRPGPGPVRRLADAVADQLADPFELARSTASTLRSPQQLADQVGSVAATARDLFRPGGAAPATPFNRDIGRRRELRAVDLDLDRIHRVGHAVGATVNDMVLAAIAGAMYDWFVAEGEAPVDVHVMVPVSTRHGGMVSEPGNHVGAVSVTLPVAEPDPVRRLHTVRSRMERMKAAHEGEGTALVLDALDHVPAVGYGALTRLVASQPLINFVVTNVPGPSERLFFLGGRIDDIVPVVPLGPGLGLGVAVLSYVDRLTISLFADPDVCHDLDVLAASITDEVDALVDALVAGFEV
jgi:WS/DGAT/MGAT family acyltransferase